MEWKQLISVFHNQKTKRNYTIHFPFCFLSQRSYLPLLFFSSAILPMQQDLNKHPQYVTWMCWIIFFDTLATLPFAKLRQEGRPRKYAFVRVAGIVVNILVVILALGLLPDYLKKNPIVFSVLFLIRQIQSAFIY